MGPNCNFRGRKSQNQMLLRRISRFAREENSKPLNPHSLSLRQQPWRCAWSASGEPSPRRPPSAGPSPRRFRRGRRRRRHRRRCLRLQSRRDLGPRRRRRRRCSSSRDRWPTTPAATTTAAATRSIRTRSSSRGATSTTGSSPWTSPRTPSPLPRRWFAPTRRLAPEGSTSGVLISLFTCVISFRTVCRKWFCD